MIIFIIFLSIAVFKLWSKILNHFFLSQTLYVVKGYGNNGVLVKDDHGGSTDASLHLATIMSMYYETYLHIFSALKMSTFLHVILVHHLEMREAICFLNQVGKVMFL